MLALNAAKALSDETAYAIVKALWDYNSELGQAYPALKAWRRQRMVAKNAFVPYHPGAVKFFKEKQIWSKEMEALQAALLRQ